MWILVRSDRGRNGGFRGATLLRFALPRGATPYRFARHRRSAGPRMTRPQQYKRQVQRVRPHGPIGAYTKGPTVASVRFLRAASWKQLFAVPPAIRSPCLQACLNVSTGVSEPPVPIWATRHSPLVDRGPPIAITRRARTGRREPPLGNCSHYRADARGSSVSLTMRPGEVRMGNRRSRVVAWVTVVIGGLIAGAGVALGIAATASPEVVQGGFDEAVSIWVENPEASIDVSWEVATSGEVTL